MYTNQPTGFDRIHWYASAKGQELYKYSVNVYKGEKHWVLEIGDRNILTIGGRK